ncbi:MAG TPA: hypothetical protein VHC19_00835 [Pirellulales bacterium]|nr:hypothetical protein [Pirellulales bacterium]
MSYFTWLVVVAARVVLGIEDELTQRLMPLWRQITELVVCFFAGRSFARRRLAVRA